MIWFTADFHLTHANIIKYCKRPFISVEEMDSTLLDNLASQVKPGDQLYYLGDLSFKADAANVFFELMKGVNIHFITGNHDSKAVISLARRHCASVTSLQDIEIDGQAITLCHYAMRVWNGSHFNAWQLYGHSHGTLPSVGKQHDVGVDANDFFPVALDGIKRIMEDKPDNFDRLAPENINR
ncbi:MAG TPA: phosphoesterase [Candidatus Lokiarchaeia archaeon]|nr:phosphoesterase [Candidatus Lokiarchaeia archaeon]